MYVEIIQLLCYYTKSYSKSNYFVIIEVIFKYYCVKICWRNDIFMEAEKLLKELTPKEKTLLCSSKGFWQTHNIDRLSIASIKFATFDRGGDRANSYDKYISLADKNKHSNFPLIELVASIWDNTLFYRLGLAVAEEALSKNISIVLLPNINIKRNMIVDSKCQYFSEDPLLSGELMASFIQGLQFRGVGGCVRYFGSFGQDPDVYNSNAVVDERALNEIYLYGFEIAVKKGRPWSIMASSHKINGIYSNENKSLLKGTLENKWGYRNVVLADGAPLNNIVSSIENGVCMEFPNSYGYSEKRIGNAIRTGLLDMKHLDHAAKNNLHLIVSANERKKLSFKYNEYLHKSIASKVVAESTILLKNSSNVLPLSRSISKKRGIAIIGEYAKGSPIELEDTPNVKEARADSIINELEKNEIEYQYTKGYDSKNPKSSKDLIKEAVAISGKAYRVILFLGQTESEKFASKDHFNISEEQLMLIDEVSKVNKNIVVILYGYGVINMPWISKVKSLLHIRANNLYSGSAIVDLLFAEVNPSAKTTETYIKDLRYSPSYSYLNEDDNSNIEYRESIFFGYRYYNMLAAKNKKEAVLFPFGYGLSYTTFEYKNIQLSEKLTTVYSLLSRKSVSVSFELTNIGSYVGAEVVQLYISQKDSKIQKPKKQLRAFEKISLKKGETKIVTFKLGARAFAHYSTQKKDFDIEDGIYFIEIGTNSEDILLSAMLTLEKIGGTKEDAPDKDMIIDSLQAYRGIAHKFDRNDAITFEDAAFESLFDDKSKSVVQKVANFYTFNSSLEDIHKTYWGRRLQKKIVKKIEEVGTANGLNNDEIKDLSKKILKLPLRMHIPFLGSRGAATLEATIEACNKKYIEAFKKIVAF